MNLSVHEERMRRFVAAGLYVVTSESMSAGRSALEIVRLVLSAGVRLIQLREKELPTRKLVELASKVRQLCDRCGSLLIVNDRVDVAMAVRADGVHLGQDDLPVRAARALAPELIIGASTHSRDEALKAESDGASYINIGPLFPTGTKAWTGEFLGMDGLAAVSRAVSVPLTVMGGIKRGHIPDLVEAGVRTVAVVTAVTAAKDPGAAARDLLDLLRGGSLSQSLS